MRLVQVMFFPVAMYKHESWTLEGWAPENWCFWIVVLEKTLESSLTERRSDSSILKEINSEYPLEGLMKLQDFGHLTQEPMHWKSPWCWERLTAKGEGGNRRWDGWRVSLTQWMYVNLSKLQETAENKGAWRATVYGVPKSRTQLSNRTATNVVC